MVLFITAAAGCRAARSSAAAPQGRRRRAPAHRGRGGAASASAAAAAPAISCRRAPGPPAAGRPNALTHCTPPLFVAMIIKTGHTTSTSKTAASAVEPTPYAVHSSALSASATSPSAPAAIPVAFWYFA